MVWTEKHDRYVKNNRHCLGFKKYDFIRFSCLSFRVRNMHVRIHWILQDTCELHEFESSVPYCNLSCLSFVFTLVNMVSILQCSQLVSIINIQAPLQMGYAVPVGFFCALFLISIINIQRIALMALDSKFQMVRLTNHEVH
jgi:hypothetical protein